MYKICLVEDESSLSEIIRLNLQLEGYDVTVFNTGESAKECFLKPIFFDLIILDVMLPGCSGFDLCEKIRQKSNVPILFLSAKGTTSDRIKGLKLGANDYISKPFDLEELLLRVSVLITKKSEKHKSNQINIGDLIVDFKTFEVIKKSTKEKYSLSKKEVALIQLFIKKEGQVIPRTEILDNVWGKNHFPTTRTIDNFILKFRKIFEEDQKNPKYFHSIRGVGYKFTM